ncbi:MAG: KAP family NTPase [Nevskia sp.]|jgi:hypothetical protein|nr:KAP family NTPase [Nevskia sp.]
MDSSPDPAQATQQQIIRQLDRNRVRHSASGDAFVVSVYGEWGIGKTRCLKALCRHYDEGLDRLFALPELPADESLVVPVFFEAWRYEHEEHLVVPLLKTIQHQLLAVGKKLAAAEKAGRGEHGENAAALKAVGGKVFEAGKTVGLIALALAKGIKFKFSVLGLGAEITGKDISDALSKGLDGGNPDPEPATPGADGTALEKFTETQESLYYESDRILRELTGADVRNNTATLTFVLLIDDLDRCLPEKAVQVLESVKLFLNVPGFAFVLAVDDEVVERGIAHRYKDYLQPDAKHNGNGNSNGHSAPISGAEYLEKIVHLPVHLPRWTEAQARAFLQQNYPDLFGTVAESPAADAAAKNTDKDEGAVDNGQAKNRQDPAKNSDNKALLDLVVASIPLVPRKLVRLAEALQHHHQQFVSLGAAAHWQPRHMARLIALQQLYPALYRHIRLRPARYWRMFSVSRNWLDEPYTLDEGAGNSLRGLQDLFKDGKLSDEAHDKLASPDQLWEQLTLLEKIQSAKQVRGAPDPITLFKDRNSEEKLVQAADFDLAQDADCCNGSTRTFADLYLHCVAPPAAKIAAAAPAYGQALPRAQIDDIADFVSGFCSIDNVGRRELIETGALVGKRLPDAAMSALLKQLTDTRYTQLLSNLDWLSDCARIMSPEQLLQLYIEHKVLEKTYNEHGAAA